MRLTVVGKDMRTANEIHLQRVHPVYTDREGWLDRPASHPGKLRQRQS